MPSSPLEEQAAEPFPLVPTTTQEQTVEDCDNGTDSYPTRQRSQSGARRTRGASLIQTFIQSNPPLGMWQATGEVGSKIPTLPEIKNGEFNASGWSQEGQMERRGTNPHEIHRITSGRRSSASSRSRALISPQVGQPKLPTRVEEEPVSQTEKHESKLGPSTQIETIGTVELQQTDSLAKGPDETGTYPNGYRFPRKHTWGQSITIGLKAFWKFFLTPLGFLITIYGLNVVGWGAMIFFVLLEAVSPGMCVPTCTDPNSARQIWIEIDSQVLNGLFCVTGFGLIPWRFRDFYYLMQWRIGGNQRYHRKLAGIYRGWYRLPESQKLPNHLGPPPVYSKKNPPKVEVPPAYSETEIAELEENIALPLPVTSIPEPPLTGARAPPTKSWNLDIVIWMYLWNTFIQAGLAGIMWGLNRHNRPSWATGFLISLGCITGIVAGIVVFIEGSKVKKVEGIPVQEYDVLETVEDYQLRKAKEDAKEAKKTAKQTASGVHHRVRHTEKIKGESWFTRH